MKRRSTQGLGWAIRAYVRKQDTGNMPMDLLVQYAQMTGDVCRRRHDEQKADEARRAEAHRERQAAWPAPRKYVTAALAVPNEVREVPPVPFPRDKCRFGRQRTYNCLAGNMRGHFFRECARLDAAAKALLNEA